MKFLRRVLPAAALFGVTTVLAADPSADRAAAAAALESGDYVSAAQLYSRTREAAEKSGDVQSWVADTVGMARAHLRRGDTAQAKLLLSEFNRRFPGLKSGGLPGEILAAEGRVPEAKAYFRELAADASADPRIRDEAELALSYLQLFSGDAAEKDEALRTLERLESEARFGEEVRLRRIEALIRLDRIAEALKLADDFPTGVSDDTRQRVELLKLLAALRAGETDKFETGWKKLHGKLSSRPDALAFEVLCLAAELATKNSHPEKAAKYWEQAYKFADGNEARQVVMRKRFNALAKVDPRQAAAVARRYAEVFADSLGGEQLTECADILIGAGRLLGAAGEPKEALVFFRMVADDARMPSECRFRAAGDAALAAEKLNEQELAKRYFEFAVSAAAEPSRRRSSQMAYAEYLIRRRDFSGAERLLRGIAGLTEPKDRERVGRLLIRALLVQHNYEAVLTEAEELRRSATPDAAGVGEFYSALALEKLGQPEEARTRYLEYAAAHPQGDLIRPARFAAAKLAADRGLHAVAAKEFFAYGEDYPADPAAPGALFRSLRSACLAKDREVAAAAFAAIGRAVGPGPVYYASALQLADHLRRGGAAEEALKLLDEVDRSKCTPSEAAMLELMRAKVLVSCRRRAEAIAVAEKLLQEHPGESVAPAAAFLAGDQYLKGEEPTRALPLLLQALKAHSEGGIFGEIAAARVAECRLELYKLDNSQQALLAAAAEFERLAAEADDPAIRLMCKCKLGWCREKLGEPEAAYRAYYQALLYAVELRRERRLFDHKWCSRSAYGALNLLLNHSWPDAEQKGVRVIAALKALELPGGEDELQVVWKEFNKRYTNPGD